MTVSFRPEQATVTACFSVYAAAEPGVMPRVLEVFAKRGLVPSNWYSAVVGTRDEELQIDIQVRRLAPRQQDLIAEALRRVVGVDAVLTAEKRAALSA